MKYERGDKEEYFQIVSAAKQWQGEPSVGRQQGEGDHHQTII
jgi:hypothetical protein